MRDPVLDTFAKLREGERQSNCQLSLVGFINLCGLILWFQTTSKPYLGTSTKDTVILNFAFFTNTLNFVRDQSSKTKSSRCKLLCKN
jgi:hypothetical protein